MNIDEKIIEIIKDVLDNHEDQDFNIETTSENIEGWDSLSHLQIIISVESEFNVKFKTSEINQLKSVRKLTKRVSELIEE